MITMDLVRFAAVTSIPAAFALGWLSFTHLPFWTALFSRQLMDVRCAL